MISGFRKCGLYPVDRDQPLRSLATDLADLDVTPATGAAPTASPAIRLTPRYKAGSPEALAVIEQAKVVATTQAKEKCRAPGQGKILNSDAALLQTALAITEAAEAKAKKGRKKVERDEKKAQKGEKAARTLGAYIWRHENQMRHPKGAYPTAFREYLDTQAPFAGTKRKRNDEPWEESEGETENASSLSEGSMEE